MTRGLLGGKEPAPFRGVPRFSPVPLGPGGGPCPTILLWITAKQRTIGRGAVRDVPPSGPASKRGPTWPDGGRGPELPRPRLGAVRRPAGSAPAVPRQ